MSKKKILVAEAKDYLADIIYEYLEDDYECLRARSLDDIIKNIPEADGIVLSLNIRKDNSLKTDSLVKMVKSQKDVPMLVMTSMLLSTVRINMLNAGADDVMTKPFNPDELKIRVKKLVR